MWSARQPLTRSGPLVQLCWPDSLLKPGALTLSGSLSLHGALLQRDSLVLVGALHQRGSF